jgi:hypothetical protein
MFVSEEFSEVCGVFVEISSKLRGDATSRLQFMSSTWMEMKDGFLGRRQMDAF